MTAPQFRYNPLTNRLDLSDTGGGGGGGGGPQINFYSYLSATLANATGDSTVVNPVPFNADTVNLGGGFNPATGIFTCPSNGGGSYVFTAVIYLTNLSSGHTAGAGAFLLNGSQQFKAFDLNPFAVSEGTDLSQTCCSGVVEMNAGDTMQITLQVGPLSSKTVGIGGMLGISNFSGFLINPGNGSSPPGNVVGPGSSTDQDIAVFNGTTGKIIADSGRTIAQIAPLTTKGDTYGYSNKPARVPVGTDGYVYTADSTQTLGVKWAPPPSSSPLTTKGDLYGFTTVNARIPVGADGYSLVANSGAAAGVDWELITQTAQSVVFNPGKVVTLVDDFFSTFLGNSSDGRVGELGWQTFGGQWSQSVGTANHPGVVGPANAAFASMVLANSDLTDSVQVGAGSVSMNFVFNLVTLSSAGNRYTFNCGLGSGGGFTSNGITFQYSDNVNSGNWQIICSKFGVGNTTTNTSIAASTGYHNLGIIVNAAGTSVAFYIDGVLAGTIATANIPSAAMSPSVVFTRSSGSLPLALFDLFYMVTQLTNSRTGGTILPVGASTVQAYTPTAVSYQVLITDSIIGVTDTSSARTITMPNAGMTVGQSWTIKDESLAAGTNNITISGNGANIDGAATNVIGNNGGAIQLYWNGSNFFIF